MISLAAGDPSRPGAHRDGDGVSFCLFSSVAERVELCLFNAGQENRYDLLRASDGHWHGFVPGAGAGQAYGYRVHGPFDPERGLRCNPAQLLIDPWARGLEGRFTWHPAVFDAQRGAADQPWRAESTDSGPFVPRSVVTDPATSHRPSGLRTPWAKSVIYEANVRGYTMRHPGLSKAERGRFPGMSNGRILEYLKALGISAVELQPVQAFADEHFLVRRGLRNFWGYNTLQFFTPDARFAQGDPVTEFREMVNALHDAGLDVLLDVAYNHTAEGGREGPSLSFRGIDNLAYYRVNPENPGDYVNDTGCGNTLNASHPVTQRLVLDSLAYWHRDMGVDGFRFDLATVLGRDGQGFDPRHPLLAAMGSDPRLATAQFIAEPWDPGHGGYQLGAFPARWAEWNDRFRDAARQFWRGDEGHLPELARRIHGSSDLFEGSGRGPEASVNFVTSHDGFTLQDVVSYAYRHNEANGENNHDGHAHNLSCNHGVEGPTENAVVNAMRRRHRLNLVATLLLSQGVPMLLAGDEFGNTQDGNNNAYAQDNPTGWLDWSGLDADPAFTDEVRALVALRARQPLLRRTVYAHGDELDAGRRDLHWFRPDGRPMQEGDWLGTRAVCKLLADWPQGDESLLTLPMVAVIINGHDREVVFTLPEAGEGMRWRLEYSTDFASRPASVSPYRAAAWSISCLSCSARSLARA